MRSWRDSKKSWKTSKEARSDRLVRSRHQEEEHLVLDKDTFIAIEEERLSEAASRIGVQAEGEADLLLDAHVGIEARLSSIQDAPEESPRRDRRRLCGQGQRMPGERHPRHLTRRQAVPHAQEQRGEQGEGLPRVEGDDALQTGESGRVQEEISQEKQRRGDERVAQRQVWRVPQEPQMAHAAERSRTEGDSTQHQKTNPIQDKTGGRITGLSPTTQSLNLVRRLMSNGVEVGLSKWKLQILDEVRMCCSVCPLVIASR